MSGGDSWRADLLRRPGEKRVVSSSHVGNGHSDSLFMSITECTGNEKGNSKQPPCILRTDHTCAVYPIKKKRGRQRTLSEGHHAGCGKRVCFTTVLRSERRDPEKTLRSMTVRPEFCASVGGLPDRS